MLFGVCGGIAEYFGLDPTLIRLIFVFLTIIAVGSPVLLYIILAFLMPTR
jgi:phage shock protein PspC (stress-responsive transcriptional regulator)